ncbi:nucleotidyltransferase domain-containing protein [Deferrisoma palaeochoriense]
MEKTLDAERAAYGRRLDEAIERARERLARRPEVERVILIGSAAKGRRDLLTDLDLVVVMHTDQPFAVRAARLLPTLELGVDVDLLVYTPDEFERLRREPFLRHALKNGRVLHEKQH